MKFIYISPQSQCAPEGCSACAAFNTFYTWMPDSQKEKRHIKKMTVYNSHVLRSHRLRGLTGIKPTEEPPLVHKLPRTLEAPS